MPSSPGKSFYSDLATRLRRLSPTTLLPGKVGFDFLKVNFLTRWARRVVVKSPPEKVGYFAVEA